MPGEIIKRKAFLFVDDDAGFLTSIQELFTEMARGRWDMFTAENHAQALALLGQAARGCGGAGHWHAGDGWDSVSPIAGPHPSRPAGGHVDRRGKRGAAPDLPGERRGLFLEKPVAPDGFVAIFAALDALAGAQPQSGFRGMMRRVGLQEVLQLECLGRKSSVLEIFTGKVRGRIFICDGGHCARRVWGARKARWPSMACWRCAGANLTCFPTPSRLAGQSRATGNRC